MCLVMRNLQNLNTPTQHRYGGANRFLSAKGRPSTSRSEHALRTHMSHADGHGLSNGASYAVAGRNCPVCLKTFQHGLIAVQHLSSTSCSIELPNFPKMTEQQRIDADVESRAIGAQSRAEGTHIHRRSRAAFSRR